MSDSRKRRIGFISCGKKKADAPCAARNLYISAYFRKMRGYVETVCDDWRILSAHHCLVHPDQVLAPYELGLKDLKRDEQRQWARKVAGQIKTAFPDVEQVVLEVHGGVEYTRDLVPLVRSFGYEVQMPVPSLPIGKRMQWYDRHMRISLEELGRKGPAPKLELGTIRMAEVSRPPGDFQNVLDEIFATSVIAGRRWVDVRAGDLHRRVDGYPGPNHRMPSCVSLMKRNMKPGDLVLEEPPSGKGASVSIRYRLPR